MCTGMEILATLATVDAIQKSGEAKKSAQQEYERSTRLEAERKDAESKAAQESYAQNIMARRAIRSNSLFTGGGQQTLGV